MSSVKQVKVDNWGIYFLQRLKHFFNRTDYCDLTLQFQDNAQLKVHRLVLSACTEYFELLERTCEMYEDCLVMPDDLQADVVVPIINFMYTGQLEFKPDLLERLYQTSLVLNMPVLTKLLGSHRNQPQQPQQHRPVANNIYGKRYSKHSKPNPSSSSSTGKRPFNVAFGNNDASKAKKHNNLNSKELGFISSPQDSGTSTTTYSALETVTSSSKFPVFTEKNKNFVKESRPTRYELPEELDEDHIFDNSFTNISYTSKPLMVHPETTKQYRSKRISLFEEGSSSSTFLHSSPNDIVECKKITVNDTSFLDEPSDTMANDTEMFTQSPLPKEEIKDSSQLFDQIIDNDIPNITIETKNKQSNIDHAKIISEVLKKYPHLVNSNKHIKLKILNTSSTTNKKKVRSNGNDGKEVKVKTEPDFTYETDVIDSKEAARLIALGPENVSGPWICLICGTPGKALHFTSYYNFRKHLVEVHNEKPSPNICEYCGLKSQKRNYLVHHQLTKHGVEPPALYSFPKCNYCKYVALNEALLVKHKLSHVERNFKRNMSSASFAAAAMEAVQKSKKQNSARKGYECMYCLKVFLRESNLYAHLKIQHKEAAKSDGIIEDSDEEMMMEEEETVTYKSKGTDMSNFIKVEVPVSFEDSYEENNVQYQIERRQDGNIHFIPKKPHVVMPTTKHKILNPGFNTQHQTLPSMSRTQQNKSTSTPQKRNEFVQEMSLSPPRVASEEIVMIDNNEYIVHDFQLYPKKKDITEYLIPNTEHKDGIVTTIPTTSMEFHNIHNTNSDTKMFIKKSGDLNEPIQIVVSNEDEYKALLNSNQSVIFDDGVSNETLAVLTAPNNSTLETSTIDLENTQTNNMMIIPEDYPISVSQAVAGDNSNIVVVYSHPVEDQNKQYQLITTQNVEGEFVQSSSIITQNYETVTTCTGATGMSSHTTVESWPIQASISKLPTSSLVEMQTMAIPQPVTIPTQTISSTMHEYHGVPLTTTISEPITMNSEHIIVQEHQTVDVNFSDTNIVTETPHNSVNVPECLNTGLSLEQQSSLDQESNVDNITTISQQSPVDNMINQQTENVVDEQSTVNNIINHQCTMETIIEEQTADENQKETINMDQTATEIDLSEATATIMEPQPQPLVIENVEEITPNNFVPVIVAVPTAIENSTGHKTDLTESVTEAGAVETIEDENNSGVEICELNNSEQQASTEEAEVQQVIEVANEEQGNDNIETDKPNDEMEEAETIENIKRAVGVDPTTIGKHETPGSPQVITDTTVDPPEKEIATVEIATLTSEWSEDEDVPETALNDAQIPKSECDRLDESMEVEESIENIQEEVKKHASCQPTSSAHTASSQEENIENTQEKQNDTKSETPVEPKVKILTLLNDWDDNDSQEEDNVTPALEVAESKPEIGTNEVVKEEEEEEEKEQEKEGKENEKDDLNKNDKIKSLVSDWDEDDEDKD